MSDAAFYDERYKRKPNSWIDHWRDSFALFVVSKYMGKVSKSVLDYGCGNGHTLAFLRDFMPGNSYAGLDISNVALKLARHRVKDALFFTELPEDVKYDIILIMGTAEHFEDPVKTLSEIGEYLKDDGIVYLEVPNCLSYSESNEEGFRKTNEGSDQDEWHLKRSSWEKIIVDAGYNIFENIKGPSPTYEFIWILKRGSDETISEGH